MSAKVTSYIAVMQVSLLKLCSFHSWYYCADYMMQLCRLHLIVQLQKCVQQVQAACMLIQWLHDFAPKLPDPGTKLERVLEGKEESLVGEGYMCRVEGGFPQVWLPF